jgi:hypothetical protein
MKSISCIFFGSGTYKNTLWVSVILSHDRDWFPIRICYAFYLEFKKNNTKLTSNGNSFGASPSYV